MEVKEIVWTTGADSTQTGRVDGLPLFTVHYRTMSKSDDHSQPYALETVLPGFKKQLYYEDAEKAKEIAVVMLRRFVERVTK